MGTDFHGHRAARTGRPAHSPGDPILQAPTTPRSQPAEASSSTATYTATYTVRHAVIAMLRELGMTRIFGNPGSTELPLFRDYPEDFSYVLGLQETVVVGMADGHAQATRNASFVNLHSAAGVGHAMANIFTAFKNRTPLVITAGQQARSLLQFDPFLHSSQAAELPKPYVKWSCEPARAEDVPQALARAYYIAMQEPRGPVLVSIPADDWDKPAEPVTLRHVGFETRPDPRTLELIGQALDAARAPAWSWARPWTRPRAGMPWSRWPSATRPASSWPHERALQLPRGPSPVRRLPARHARAHRAAAVRP